MEDIKARSKVCAEQAPQRGIPRPGGGGGRRRGSGEGAGPARMWQGCVPHSPDPGDGPDPSEGPEALAAGSGTRPRFSATTRDGCCLSPWRAAHTAAWDGNTGLRGKSSSASQAQRILCPPSGTPDGGQQHRTPGHLSFKDHQPPLCDHGTGAGPERLPRAPVLSISPGPRS